MEQNTKKASPTQRGTSTYQILLTRDLITTNQKNLALLANKHAVPVPLIRWLYQLDVTH